MTTPTNVLNIAQREIGYIESPVNRTRYNDWYYGHVGEQAQWCATFVSWVFYMAGIPLPAENSKGFDNCQAGYQWFERAHNVDIGAQPGDVVFYDWNGDRTADHVGVVQQVGRIGFLAIEGNTSLNNQSNGGSVMLRSRSYADVLAFAKPNYEVLQVIEIAACKAPGGGHWVLTTDGGVRAIGGAPFCGSYPGLSLDKRQGVRSFIDIEANDEHDASKGYTIFGNDDSAYSFPASQ